MAEQSIDVASADGYGSEDRLGVFQAVLERAVKSPWWSDPAGDQSLSAVKHAPDQQLGRGETAPNSGRKEWVVQYAQELTLLDSFCNTAVVLTIIERNSFHDSKKGAFRPVQKDGELKKKLVVRLCGTVNPLWARRKTINEAVVLRYLQRHLSENKIPPPCLPVPTVFDYCDNAERSPIPQRDYLLLSYVEGQNMSEERYASFSLEQKQQVIEMVLKLLPILWSIRFTRVGSFIDAEMTVGEEVDTARGPFDSFEAFMISSIHKRCAELLSAFPTNSPLKPAAQEAGTLIRETSDDLYEAFKKRNEESDDKDAKNSKPYCLTHNDLSPKNLMYVEESNSTIKITGLLDWEWAAASVPDSDWDAVAEYFGASLTRDAWTALTFNRFSLDAIEGLYSELQDHVETQKEHKERAQIKSMLKHFQSSLQALSTHELLCDYHLRQPLRRLETLAMTLGSCQEWVNGDMTEYEQILQRTIDNTKAFVAQQQLTTVLSS